MSQISQYHNFSKLTADEHRPKQRAVLPGQRLSRHHRSPCLRARDEPTQSVLASKPCILAGGTDAPRKEGFDIRIYEVNEDRILEISVIIFWRLYNMKFWDCCHINKHLWKYFEMAS